MKPIINTTNVTSEGIKQSGLPTDFKKAIAEYIWNGFDANASEIDINYISNNIDTLIELSIKDNGNGINLNEIESSFGAFLDSKKRDSFDTNRILKGKKGKGRFSFQQFSSIAVWNTIFFDESSGKKLNYKIKISSDSLNGYEIIDKSISNLDTGTEVVFQNFNISSSILEDESFIDYLSNEFGWFLFLNKEKEYSLRVNGENIDYSRAFVRCIENHKEEIDDYEFDISFILWKNKINEKYYYYYLNENNYFIEKEHTSFNNKISDFHHSVYISSSFFEKFRITEGDNPTLGFFENQSNPIFRSLKKILKKLVSDEQNLFVKEKKANELLEKYNRSGVFPNFSNSAYDRLRRNDLEVVIKELYCLNPAIFDGLKKTQQKTFIGFLNLLLDSEQRDNILNILESIIELTEDERVEFSKVLNKTSIIGITNFIKLMEGRKNTINILNKLVYDLEKFTDERNHIQRLVENNYWLFGEQYHLVSADTNFETMLNNYLVFLETSKKEQPKIKEKLKQKDRLKRPDIFICRKNLVSDEYTDPDSNIEENIIVELKRPSVIIGQKQYAQIENYIRFIVNEPKFNSQLRKWKLILIGKSVDNFITDKYDSNSHKGKKFLVESVPNKNYEIYAYTWDDINRIFEVRHNHILESIKLESDLSLDEIISPDTLTKMAISKN